MDNSLGNSTTFRLEPTLTGRSYRLLGELDLATAGELVARLHPDTSQEGDLALDLSTLQFIDSSGLRALISVSRQLEGRGKLILRSPNGQVATVLDLVRAETFPNMAIEHA